MGCVSSSAARTTTPAGGGGGGGGGVRQGGGPPPLIGNPNNRRVRAGGAWTLEGGPVTASQLAMKRQTFWEGQSAGRPIIWSNLRVAAEAMIAGDVELANTVLDAADIRVPHGDLSVCYDALGTSYAVPRYAYSTPSNVISDKEAASLAASRRKEHTGPVSSLPVVARISAGTTTLEQDVKLTVRSNQTVREVKTALHELLASGSADQVADANTPRPNKWAGKGLPPARQRIMFRGRELTEDFHMQECGVAAGSFLQVFVRPE